MKLSAHAHPSVMNRHSHNHNQNSAPRGRPVSALEEAHANNSFEHFLTASTLKTILGTYRNICEYLHLKPNVVPLFYPKLKAYVNSWKAKPLWKKLDARANQKCYGRGKICPNTRLLIIGAGPCGLRTAIEAQLLGAKVVVVEKRDRLSRNNVLHLWPFVIEDLRALGAKKFFGKFCAGAIDHISIRQLQCVLLKVALLLGVEIHTDLNFENLVPPNAQDKTGWRAEFKPAGHPVAQYEFDVIIGADGKRNTLQGFKRKEFRGKLAIAITANFINKRTEAEARVEEISGVAFIFNQKFFKDLYAETGIDLENIVYYKDDTHYFVMTAKKQSLIEKGVIKQDLNDTERLLAPDNVDRDELMNYAREAADFSTNYQMPDLEFAVNHYGQPDVAMFDFTSMYAADNASRIIERDGYRLLAILVGDSLLEPFWPTGSGCARGFLSSMDAAWAIRGWGSGHSTPLEVVAERESIYRLLAQTTPENLNKDYKSYTLDPSTRYPNLNKNVLLPHQVTSLYDTDNPKSIELKPRPIPATNETAKKRRRRESHVDPDTLLYWIREQVREHENLEVADITTCFKDGRVLCAILHHYRPDLLDFTAISAEDAVAKNQHAFDLLEKELGIPPVMTGEELANTEVPDYLTMISYLSQVYDTFRREIPHIKHPKLELPDTKRSDAVVKSHNTALAFKNVEAVAIAQPQRPSSRHKRHAEHPSVHAKLSNAVATQERKTRKRKTLEKVGASVEERQKRLEDIVSNRVDRQSKRRQQRKMQTEQFIKSMQMLQSNCKPDHSEPFEDYSIFLYRQTAPNFEDRVKDLEKKFTYVPDRDSRLPTQTRRETDEDFAARIKDLEDKWREPVVVEKKPKDLLRAIGKIETSDWNIKEIEKKIIENKLGKTVNKDKERVPKWSREQFLARQTKMERQHLERQDSTGGKFAEIDKNIKQLEHKLKEGTTRDLNQRKVASITEKLVGKVVAEPVQPKPIQKSNSRTAVIAASHGSECCHFCSKRVYLMERLSAEGKFFHRGCFRCQYCQMLLRLGSYMYDREGLYGHRFYCTQHFGMPGEIRTSNTVDAIQKEAGGEEKILVSGVVGVDLLDRVQTPERVKFSNLSTGHVSSDHEESPSPIDEDEWTDRNFRNSVVDTDSSDNDSSSASDTDSEDDEAFEEALEEPPTKEGTMRWAERFKKRYSHKHDDDSESENYSSSDQFSYDENSSGDDDSDTATEGEEEIRARELRKQEVRVEPPVTDTGTDTEIASDESSSESSSEIQNSATEISTDSEFAHDDPTPTRDKLPAKIFDDYVTKTRGTYGSPPKKVQVKSGILQQPLMNGRTATQSKNVELKFTGTNNAPTLVTTTNFSTPTVRKTPAPPTSLLFGRNEGYALNRTQSTGGIATKVSLELKKKYLLGEPNFSGSIQKSGSASTLDSKFKSFHTNISDCQKLLKPASEISASMQVFCSKLNERTSPLSPTFGSPLLFNKELGDAKPEVAAPKIVNETEGRPRSPVHERSIVVPTIDWNKNKQGKEKFVDSLSSSDSDSNDDSRELPKIFNNIPRLEVHDDSGEIVRDEAEMALDSLNVNADEVQGSTEPPKSVANEKKTLNKPKLLPNLENDPILAEVHSALHTQQRTEEVCSPEGKENNDSRSLKNSSGRSTPSIIDDVVTAALTETELSDWARDSAVSDDFEEYELNANVKSAGTSKDGQNRMGKTQFKKATITELDELTGHICGKKKNAKDAKNKSLARERVNDILRPSIENIEFMDTGTETSSDDVYEVKNNGYVQFHDEEDFVEDSLSCNVNDIVETTNPTVKQNHLSTPTKNTGYCVIGHQVEETNYNKEGEKFVVENEKRAEDVKKLADRDMPNKDKQSACDNNEEDSLLIIETGTTTEENTCSDSTVKNLGERIASESVKNDGFKLMTAVGCFKDKKRLEEKLAKVKQDMIKLNEPVKTEAKDLCSNEKDANVEFEEHCQRLRSKIEFSNVKDSIDVRKSRRKSKSESGMAKPDLIQEEKGAEGKVVVVAPLTPSKLYKREEIEKERNINQLLVQEMVMNKMRAQNKSLERKKRNRNSFSPIRPFELSKSATTQIANDVFVPPDVLLPAVPNQLQKSQTVSSMISASPPSRPGSVLATPTANEGLFGPPDVKDATPKAPPRVKNDEAKKTAEKLQQNALAGLCLMSDEGVGQSHEDKLAKLRQKSAAKTHKDDGGKVDVHVQDSIESLVVNTERRNSLLYSNDTLKRNTSFRRSKSGDDAKPNSRSAFDLSGNNKLSLVGNSQDVSFPPVRTKSVSAINRPVNNNNSILAGCKNENASVQYCKSDPNLLLDDGVGEGGDTNKKERKKCKDRERRKSITKFIADIFTKKKDGSPSGGSGANKSFLSRISPKSKNKSKSCVALDLDEIDKIVEEKRPLRRNSVSELTFRVDSDGNISPPPVPPLPLNYTACHKDESSDAENEFKHQVHSSSDTLDQSMLHDSSLSSFSGRRSGRSARKAVRQAQLKRHRVAQEIQRKLEETEVKTRELENRGISVEKALRGEANSVDSSREETDLLREWFDLMRDRTELRRYERELMVRAQELELEDRHARLQHELRDRLESNELKTKEEMDVEGSIIKEMMDIVAKRDSLIALLEEDRIRYTEEDRDFEEQMLAKGIHLTPLVKSPNK